MFSTKNHFKDLREASMNTALKTTLLAGLLGAVPGDMKPEEHSAPDHADMEDSSHGSQAHTTGTATTRVSPHGPQENKHTRATDLQ